MTCVFHLGDDLKDARSNLLAACQDVSDEDARRRPAGGGWAVIELLAHLPDETNRFILSGGEPLVELELLLYLLEAGRERYPAARISFQTNGDLLDGPTLRRLLATGLDAIAIASQDAFHPRPDGKFEAQIGRPGNKRGDLNYPTDVAVDTDGDIYVCDWSSNRWDKGRVHIFTPEGQFLTSLVGDAQRLSAWAQLTVDARRNQHVYFFGVDHSLGGYNFQLHRGHS